MKWGIKEMRISKDQIREWKKDEWKFRVKKVKGYKYISRRKGKDERGLGRYNARAGGPDIPPP